ncbi:hypothetical protein B7C51_24925 (plasmid) [Paenibacillus larvae subsp. pulvifaciens]|uniref:Uncharacterized protein n=1 Tax=Paenibacillus larvae subsp. pulvifaciens TaxID=1477 RepID=A0A1V0V0P3_9BACL|nr:hypothetical protein [Paenibacillus larvae]ARF70720.1 hypothetical protein B7C51_24925 [Paenibacillus larvae subsp. pulvifaciens]
MDKQEYVNLLRKILDDIKHNNNQKENLKKKLYENYGVFRGETQQIINGDIPLKKEMIIRIGMELYFITKIKEINPKGAFSEKEIEKAVSTSLNEDEILQKDLSIENFEKEEFPLVFRRVIKESENKYIVFEYAYRIAELYKRDLLKYNLDITKKYKYVQNKKGILSQSIDINFNLVSEIAESILNSTYDFKPVVLNVLKKPNENFIHYNEDELTLRIDESRIDILNGFHTILAIERALDLNHNIKVKIELEINYLELEEAKIYYNKLLLKGGVN